MFNSLATFLFGAQATSEPSDNCVENPEQQKNNQANEESCAVAAGDVIEVTSSTPSVAGNQRGTVQRSSNGNGSGKRGGAKQRRARQRQQQQQKEQQQQQQKESKQAPSITKLLTPNGESPLEEDFNEDEWYIVEKEDGEEDSLPRSDSEEEELSVVESKPATSSGTSLVPTGPAYRRRQLHLQTHSLYSGPRPHQHRNRMSRTLNIRVPLTMSALSPPRIVPISDAASNGSGSGNGGDDSDNSLTQSLYAPPSALSPCNSESSDGSTGHGSVVLMEESWYVTPPPCFTSIGPINMEASPFENLLIEHPSMSVYHSIRSSQAGTESFVNLDLGAAESTAEPEPEAMTPEEQAQLERQNRATSARFDRHHAAEQKKIELARRSLMNKVHDDHHRFVKTALTRSNKVMAQQSKGHQRRRSDMQHFRNVSGANNNRKCC